MWMFWIAVGFACGKLSSPEVQRALRWKLHKLIDGDPNGDAVNEYRSKQRRAS